MPEVEFSLSPLNNERIANLFGQFNEHIKQIESRLEVEIHNRAERFTVKGEQTAILQAQQLLQRLYQVAEKEPLSAEKVHVYLQQADLELNEQQDEEAGLAIRTRKSVVHCRGQHQIEYVESIRHHDLTFGIGPAGTGKTFLAVACAVEALEAEQVRRLVLVRPAVEAGERLGFLPGDLAQKVDPYLRPIYDALYEFLGFDRGCQADRA